MPTVKPLAVLRSVSGAGTSDGTTGHIPQMKSDKLYCDKPFQIGRAREPESPITKTLRRTRISLFLFLRPLRILRIRTETEGILRKDRQ